MTKVAVTLQLRLDDDWRARLPLHGEPYDPAVPVVDLVASRVMAMTFAGPWTLEGIAAVRQP